MQHSLGRRLTFLLYVSATLPITLYLAWHAYLEVWVDRGAAISYLMRGYPVGWLFFSLSTLVLSAYLLVPLPGTAAVQNRRNAVLLHLASFIGLLLMSAWAYVDVLDAFEGVG